MLSAALLDGQHEDCASRSTIWRGGVAGKALRPLRSTAASLEVEDSYEDRRSRGMERTTICFPRYGTREVLQHGDKGFKEEMDRLYRPAESKAIEALVHLKSKIQQLSGKDFFIAVTEGIASIVGSEMSLVGKRILVDDQDSAIEMPPIGEPGSCMMLSAFHYRNRDGSKDTITDTKLFAYECPCAYMRHDKVFVIPGALGQLLSNNPNPVPLPGEAYIAVPLFAEGKCFAHFGVIWSQAGAAQRVLSWSFIEMLLHSLEDAVLARLLAGSDFPLATLLPSEKARVIPHDAVPVAQSLRPYAGSLSHELRTPMQGIVGMLDVMYATVGEAIKMQEDERLRSIFENLRDNIEIVQDSSRRAVEAADNVVHAYDMNMSVPEVSASVVLDEPESGTPLSTRERRPEILVADSNLPLSRPNKRRHDESLATQDGTNEAVKCARIDGTTTVRSALGEPSGDIKKGLAQAEKVHATSRAGLTIADALADAPTPEDIALVARSIQPSARMIAPGLRHTSMREIFQHVINEGLKLGGRPEVATAKSTQLGECIEVCYQGPNGVARTKTIDWEIDPSVPGTMFIDEKELTKLISCVFLNAVKFTNQENGHVSLRARMVSRQKSITIRIADNGPGIPAAFLPKMFQAFSRENGSITRQNDGLGLGLMVAKGIARKLGGDLKCTRAETNGPQHGSEFEIKIPVHAGDAISRPPSPFNSPAPRRASLDVQTHLTSPSVSANTSPTRLTRALHSIVDRTPPSTSIDLVKKTPCPQLQSLLSVPQPHQSVIITSSSPPSPPEEAPPPVIPRLFQSAGNVEIDRGLASRYPIIFLVAEDNNINRKLLVSMLSKLGYDSKRVRQAHDGTEAVRQMELARKADERVDVVLMDLWMPLMDGFEATEKIMSTHEYEAPIVLAVTADVTDGAYERAVQVGMQGLMTKPYKLHDLQRLITQYCAKHAVIEQSL